MIKTALWDLFFWWIARLKEKSTYWGFFLIIACISIVYSAWHSLEVHIIILDMLRSISKDPIFISGLGAAIVGALKGVHLICRKDNNDDNK